MSDIFGLSGAISGPNPSVSSSALPKDIELYPISEPKPRSNNYTEINSEPSYGKLKLLTGESTYSSNPTSQARQMIEMPIEKSSRLYELKPINREVPVEKPSRVHLSESNISEFPVSDSPYSLVA